MPKRRPIFEFKGLAGLLGSPSSGTSYYRSSSSTDESPRHPRHSLSSRYNSSPRRRRHSQKHKRRHKHRKANYSRRKHYASDQKHRHRRYQGNRDNTHLHPKPHIRSLTDDDLSDDILDGPGLDTRSPRHGVTRTPVPGFHRSHASRPQRHRGSPPPFDALTGPRYGSPPPEYPNGTHISPERGDRTPLGPALPYGYPDHYNRAERSVDPALEHSFSRSGLPEEDEEGESAPSHMRGNVHDHRQRHRSSHRRTHRGRKRRSKHRKRRKRAEASKRRKKSVDSDVEPAASAGEVKFDESGNPIAPPSREQKEKTENDSKGKDSDVEEGGKKGRKRKIAKVAAVALGAILVGFIAKKIFSKKKKKKEEEEAQEAAEQQEAAGPFGGEGGELFSEPNPLQLPVPKTKFSVKVPENEAFIVERGGKYNRRLSPGSNMLIPFVDRIAYRFSLKEISMAVPIQQCYTRENVSVMASAFLFAKVEDAVPAAYGVDDARRSLMLLAQTSMRREIARRGIYQTLQDRDELEHHILGSMNRASRPWGVRCTRFEIRDLDIPDEMKVAQAEMARRVLASQGARDAMVNQADGEMHAQMRKSQARQIEIVNQAIGEAHAISERGEAIAGAIRDVAEAVSEPGGEKALQTRIADEFTEDFPAVLQENGQGIANLGQDTRLSPTGPQNSQPSPIPSSHQASQSHQRLPHSVSSRPPVTTAVGTQSPSQDSSNFPQRPAPVPPSSASLSQTAPRADLRVPLPQGQYVGPTYPQTSRAPSR